MCAPKVSIIIPAFNAAATLDRALQSVALQTHRNWEICLMDDGSTDATKQVVEQWQDRFGPRLRHHAQANAGPSAARNAAIAMATGDFVIFLDADDALRPDAIERYLLAFATCPEMGMVFSDYSCIDLNGQVIVSAIKQYFALAEGIPGEDVADWLRVLRGGVADWIACHYFVATIAAMIRGDVLRRSGVRFPEDLSYGEEQVFFTRIARRCIVGYLRLPTAIHYYTRGSVTRSSTARNLIGRLRLNEALLKEAREFGGYSVRRALLAKVRACRRSVIKAGLADAVDSSGAIFRRLRAVAIDGVCGALCKGALE